MDLSKFSVLKEKKRNEYKWHSRKDRWILREVHFNKKCFKTDEESVRRMSISNCKPLFKTTVIRCILLIKQYWYIIFYFYTFLLWFENHFQNGSTTTFFFSKSPLTKFVTMAWARIWTWSEPPWLHCQLGRWRHQ